MIENTGPADSDRPQDTDMTRKTLNPATAGMAHDGAGLDRALA